MRYYLNESCEICGHLGVDHEYRGALVSDEQLKAICWACASCLPRKDEEILNLNCYHEFKFDNLNYLQKLYEKKQKVK